MPVRCREHIQGHRWSVMARWALGHHPEAGRGLRSLSAASLSPLLVLQMKLSRPSCVCQLPRSCPPWLPACWNTANSVGRKPPLEALGISERPDSSLCFLRLSACQLVPHIRNILGQHSSFQPHRFVLFHDYFLIIALGKTALGPIPNHVPGVASYTQDGVFG